MSATLEIQVSTTPYPGLRPFQEHEADIFFGRETQTDEMLRKLRKSRFLMVTGPSGCGKSSLVRAGMIPALRAGFLTNAGGRWCIADLRPGEEPMQRLAHAVLSRPVSGEEEHSPEIVAFVRATLQRGPLGLVDVLRERPLPPGTNLLLLVDQFEEIFRFRRAGAADEADAFVALLLASAKQREVPVYVVLTMRSDFLGDCSLFSGLPEAINDNQFLTPRLTREQAEAAIVMPARVFGGEIEPGLVNRLLNDMVSESEPLPVLQHTLMRMWGRASERTGSAFPRITPDDYAQVGMLAGALSKHADEVYDALSDTQKSIAEMLFRRLTERGEDQRDTRHPTRVSEVAEVAGVPPEQVMSVAEAFRQPERSFIMPPVDIPLRLETVLDIGHESLIRLWRRLTEWVKEEERSSAFYQYLRRTARLWTDGEADLLGGVGLERAKAWRSESLTGRAWASRYGKPEDFDLVMAYLDRSERHQDEQRRQDEAELARRMREEADRQADARTAAKLRLRAWALGILAAVALVLAASAVIALFVLRSEKARLKSEIRAVEKAYDESRQRGEALLLARSQLDSANLFRQAVEAQDSSLAARAEATADSLASKNASSIVYIHFRGAVTRQTMEELRAQLNREGFPAPGTERIASDFTSRVAFFYDEDRAVAEAVRERTMAFFRDRKCPIELPRRYFPKFQGRARPGTVEVWIVGNCPQ